MLIKAAATKLGVALVPRCIIEPALKSQQIAVALDAPFLSTQGYFLLYPERRRGSPPIGALRRWLMEAATAQAGQWTPAKQV